MQINGTVTFDFDPVPGPQGPQGPAGPAGPTDPTIYTRLAALEAAVFPTTPPPPPPPPPPPSTTLNIGAFFAENPNDFPAFKAKGLTHVHIWAQPNDPGTTAKLDAAHAAGLKVWLGVTWMFDNNVYHPERINGLMDPYKNHPALAGWYAYDEPNYNPAVSVANVQTLYNAIKAKDSNPAHPVIATMAFGQSTSGSQYLPYLDHRWWDYYPISAGPASWYKGNFESWLAATSAGNKPAGGVVQTFSWPGQRIPTPAEVQTMAVDAVLVQPGPVKTVVFYAMDGQLRTNAPLWDGLATITAAMRAAAGV